jgi:hypothetical protein
VPLAVVGTTLVGLAAGISFAPAFTGAARLHPEGPATAIGFVNSVGAGTVLAGTALLGLAFSAGIETWAFLALAVLWAASAVLAMSGPRSPAG